MQFFLFDFCFFPFSFPFHSRPAGLPSPFASSTPANSPICAFDFHPIFIFSTRPRFPLPFSPLLLQHYLPCNLQFAFSLPTIYITALLLTFFSFGAKRDATTTPPPSQHNITLHAYVRHPPSSHPTTTTTHHLLPYTQQSQKARRGACICQHLYSCFLVRFLANECFWVFQ